MNHDALILDFGGVLTEPMQDIMARFAAAVGIEPDDLARSAYIAYTGEEDELVTAFETGRMSEEDFSEGFAARLTETTGVEIAPDGLLERLFDAVRLEDEMLSAVAAARAAGVKTGLLSNSWGHRLYPRPLLDRVFDAVVISGEVGLRKPDPAVFTMTVARLGVHPARCVFVDDLEGHVEVAAELGMTTVLHRTPDETLTRLESILGVPLRAHRSSGH